MYFWKISWKYLIIISSTSTRSWWSIVTTWTLLMVRPALLLWRVVAVHASLRLGYWRWRHVTSSSPWSVWRSRCVVWSQNGGYSTWSIWCINIITTSRCGSTSIWSIGISHTHGSRCNAPAGSSRHVRRSLSVATTGSHWGSRNWVSEMLFKPFE